MKVQVYRNLHRKCWSVRASEGPRKGRVIDHARHVILGNGSIRISEASRRRAIRDGQRNVHAVIEGERIFADSIDLSLALVGFISYNPFRGDSFMLHRTPTFDTNAIALRLPPTTRLPIVEFGDQDEAVCSIWIDRWDAKMKKRILPCVPWPCLGQ